MTAAKRDLARTLLIIAGIIATVVLTLPEGGLR